MTTVEETIKAAAARGIEGLPEPSRLTHARVWPAPPRWIAEVGEPPHNESVGDGLYNTKDAADQAARDAIRVQRERLAELLPADLAEGAAWPDPIVNIWDS